MRRIQIWFWMAATTVVVLSLGMVTSAAVSAAAQVYCQTDPPCGLRLATVTGNRST